jgi:hypothetical protein
MIAGMLLLVCSRLFGEGDLQNSEISLLANGQQSFLLWLININNFFLGDVDDLVQSLNLSSQDLCDPESPVHKSLSSFDGDEVFAFSEEQSEGS